METMRGFVFAGGGGWKNERRADLQIVASDFLFIFAPAQDLVMAFQR